MIALLVSTLLLAAAPPGTLPSTRAAGGPALEPLAGARQPDSEYRRAAHHLLERIEASSGRYPHLAAIRSAAEESETARPFWIAYHYAHGVSWGPNPDYRPGKKSAPTIRIFSPADGIELNIYFYEGQWPGQAIVSPVAIEKMKVAVFIDGAESAALTLLRLDVSRIIEDERRAYMSARAHPAN